jgi:hypothetical protein
MKKTFVHIVILLLLQILFVACGGGGGVSVDSSTTGAPIVSGDSSGNMKLDGILKLDVESNSLISSVGLYNLALSFSKKSQIPSGCKIISTNFPENLDITDGAVVDYQITLSSECYNIDKINLNAIKTTKFANGAIKNENYAKEINFDNSKILNAYNSLQIDITNSNSIEQGDIGEFSYQLNNSQNTQLPDADTQSIKIATTDSSRIVLIDSDNSVNEITKNKPYDQVNFKGILAGKANLAITVIATIDGITVKKLKNIELNIISQIINCSLKKILLDPNEFIANEGTIQTINIYTLDENNQPVQSRQVNISYPIVGNTIFGEFDKNSIISDQDGKASIAFTPKNSTNFAGTTKEVNISSVSNGCDTISELLKIKFPQNKNSANLVDQIILSPQKIKVISGLAQDITIYTLNKDHQPISADVKIEFPQEDGQVFGEFDTYSFKTDDKGKYILHYTAPHNIDSFDGDKNLTLSVQDINAKTVDLTLSFEKTILSSKEYTLSLLPSDAISVNNSSAIIVKIIQKDDNTTIINDQNVNNVNITSLNKLIYFDNNSSDYNYAYSSGLKSIDIHTKPISGIDVLHVSANIFDNEKNVTISQDFPVTIISDAPNSISLVYKSSSFTTPFYYDTFVVHAVDKYGNPAREGSKIYLGAVNGIIKDSNGNELYVNKGGAIASINGEKTEFDLPDNNFDFANVQYRDTLIVLAEEDKMSPYYLGGWIVDTVSDDSKALYFDKPYLGISESGLTFLVGNERRYDICTKEPALADFDSVDGSYTLVSGGMKDVILRYPPNLIGKDIYLYANSYDNKRVGVAIRKKLWGVENEISASVNTDNCVKNSNCDVYVSFHLNSANAPLEDENITLDNFTISSLCGNPQLKKSNTLCDGQIIINTDYNATEDGECSVAWNNSLNYAH